MPKYRGCVFSPEVSRDVEPDALVLYDRSRYGNNGVITPGAGGYVQLPSGLWVYEYDGTSKIDIGNAGQTLANTTTGTWLAWINLTDITPAVPSFVICFGDTDALELLAVRITSAGLLYANCYDAGAHRWALDTDAIIGTDETWIAIGVTQDGTAPVLYVNGLAPAQAFSTAVNTTIWFSSLAGLDNGFIGNGSYLNNVNRGPLIGLTGFVSLYNYALTAGQILQKFESERSLFGV